MLAARGKRACADRSASQSKVARRGNAEAAAATAMQTVGGVTDCSVCFLHYDAGEHSPLLLPCWHTFCAKCVGSLSPRQCPACRKSFKVGEAKPNFLAQDLLAERQGEVKIGMNRAAGLLSSLMRGGTETSEPSGLECVVCQALDKEVAATHVCKQPSCSAFFCQEHGGQHREKKPDHELCELGSAQLCGVHRGELRQSFCVNCTEITCPKCGVDQHGGHTTMSVGALLERLRGELPGELATLEAALEATRQRMADMEGLAAEMEGSIVEAERAADMVVAVVTQWRRETQVELDLRRRAAQAGVATERAEQEGLVEKLHLACDVVRGALQGTPDVAGMEGAVQAVVGVGEARVCRGVRHGEREREREGLKLVLVGAGRGALEGAVRALLDGAKVRDVGLGRRRRGGGGVMVRRCAMGTVGAGRIGNQGDGNLEFSDPCGAAVLEDDNLVVCDTCNHRLQILTVDGNFVREIGSRGEGNLEFNAPSGVTVLEDGNLVVCEWGNHRLQILTVNGHFVRTIGSHGEGNLEFNAPCSVAVLGDGNLVVCDAGNHRLQILTVDGKFVRTIGGRGVDNLEFDEPCGVAVLEDGNLVVCDSANHRLQILTVAGKFVRTIGGRGEGNLEFSDPCGVAVLEDGNLVVCEWGNHRLQILTVNGKFVRMIPCYRPVHLAVLDRDHVAVSIGPPHHHVDIVRVSR